MNIFDIYSEKIKSLVKKLSKQNLIEIPDSLKVKLDTLEIKILEDEEIK